MAVICVVALFNGLVRMRNLVREGWGGIDVQLKRRTDLAPNLVGVAQGYAAHERATLEEVTRMRAASVAANDMVKKNERPLEQQQAARQGCARQTRAPR